MSTEQEMRAQIAELRAALDASREQTREVVETFDRYKVAMSLRLRALEGERDALRLQVETTQELSPFRQASLALRERLDAIEETEREALRARFKAFRESLAAFCEHPETP